MISLLLWTSPWAGVVLADFFIKRHGVIDVAELYRSPQASAYGDIKWGAIIAFLAGLAAAPSHHEGEASANSVSVTSPKVRPYPDVIGAIPSMYFIYR
jgi:cytosine/uracil/thiamine/allantoin permease